MSLSRPRLCSPLRGRAAWLAGAKRRNHDAAWMGTWLTVRVKPWHPAGPGRPGLHSFSLSLFVRPIGRQDAIKTILAIVTRLVESHSAMPLGKLCLLLAMGVLGTYQYRWPELLVARSTLDSSLRSRDDRLRRGPIAGVAMDIGTRRIRRVFWDTDPLEGCLRCSSPASLRHDRKHEKAAQPSTGWAAQFVRSDPAATTASRSSADPTPAAGCAEPAMASEHPYRFARPAGSLFSCPRLLSLQNSSPGRAGAWAGARRLAYHFALRKTRHHQ